MSISLNPQFPCGTSGVMFGTEKKYEAIRRQWSMPASSPNVPPQLLPSETWTKWGLNTPEMPMTQSLLLQRQSRESVALLVCPGLHVQVFATRSGNMRRHHIRVVTGDCVTVGGAPNDVTHGLITFRQRYMELSSAMRLMIGRCMAGRRIMRVSVRPLHSLHAGRKGLRISNIIWQVRETLNMR